MSGRVRLLHTCTLVLLVLVNLYITVKNEISLRKLEERHDAAK